METLKTKTTLSASELRRKNWVNEEVLGNVIISDIQRDGSIWVEAKGLNLQHEPTIEHYHLSKGNFEPIPLSPDILLSAGFEERNDSLQKSVGLGITLEWDEDYKSVVLVHFDEIIFDLDNKIKTVHHLQNIFHSMTGEELNIQL